MNQGDSKQLQAVKRVQEAVLNPKVPQATGAGKAYQSVAQSTALAIQDAADNLRSLETIANTAIGVALSKYLEDPSSSSTYPDVIDWAQCLVTEGASQLELAGSAAQSILQAFTAELPPDQSKG